MADAAKRIVIPRKFHSHQGPWFIWSMYWGRWHRRDPKTGGASGYTDDISKAGVFGYETASAYHTDDAHRRDAAVPVRRAIPHLKAKLVELAQETADTRALMATLGRAPADGGE